MRCASTMVICLGAVACARGAGDSPGRVGDLIGHENQVVTIDVEPAKIVWQHMGMSVPGKMPIYVDVAGSSGAKQFVAYVEKEPDCKGVVVLTGKVIVVSGPGKRPKRDDLDAMYSETSLDVHRWVCR